MLIGGSSAVHRQYELYLKNKIADAVNDAFPIMSKKLSEKTRKKLSEQ